jgi:hypothetical protein
MTVIVERGDGEEDGVVKRHQSCTCVRGGLTSLSQPSAPGSELPAKHRLRKRCLPCPTSAEPETNGEKSCCCRHCHRVAMVLPPLGANDQVAPPAPPCPRVDQRWLPGVPPGLGHREAGRTGCGAELKFLQRGWLQKTPDPASRTHAHSRAHTDVHYGPLERDAQARVFDGSTRSLVWILERDGGGGLAADAVASSRRRRSSRSLCSRGSLEVAAAPRCCRDEAD